MAKYTQEQIKAQVKKMYESGELVIVEYDPKDGEPVYALREIAEANGWKPIVN